MSKFMKKVFVAAMSFFRCNALKYVSMFQLVIKNVK